MLSDETGLEKASLYYRYPAGKDQIVTTVAESVAAWFESNIFELLDGTGTPRARISLAAERLEEFYSSGSKASILDVLSIQSGPEELRIVLRKMTQRGSILLLRSPLRTAWMVWTPAPGQKKPSFASRVL
jgi:TetR/AcrR family transcriptional repressor of lmrAB and yxaGH operons